MAKYRKKFDDSTDDRDPSRIWMEYGGGYVTPHEGRYAVVSDRLIVIRDADILFQTHILRLGERTEDGQIVSATTPAWSAMLSEVLKDPSLLEKFPTWHRKFEEFLAGAYHASLWDEVVLTPPSGDRGFDVVALNRGLESCRILDEAKAFKPSRRVNHQIVRALVGVLHLNANASKVRLTTTSSFAPTILSGSEFALLIPEILELRDGEQFLRWLGTIDNQSKSR